MWYYIVIVYTLTFSSRPSDCPDHVPNCRVYHETFDTTRVDTLNYCQRGPAFTTYLIYKDQWSASKPMIVKRATLDSARIVR